MKKLSRNWSSQEDQILKNIMKRQLTNLQEKRKWDQIAQVLQDNFPNCEKTGKQCRERWHNQLAPQSSNRGVWSMEENELLFVLHDEFGNKWAKIAQKIEGRTDNTVKNHFYSTMRRGLRKLNSYIHNIKRKNGPVKEFKAQILNKILIVVDGNQNDKLDAKDTAFRLSKQIKKALSVISLDEEDTDDKNQILKQTLFKNISDFAKSCKRRKGKKVGVLSGSEQQRQSFQEIEKPKKSTHSKKSKKYQTGQESSLQNQPSQIDNFKTIPTPLPSTEINKPKCSIQQKSSLESVLSNNNNSFGIIENNPFALFHQEGFNLGDRGTVDFPLSMEFNQKPFTMNNILESPTLILRSGPYNLTPGTPGTPFNFNANTNNLVFNQFLQTNQQQSYDPGFFGSQKSYEKGNQ